MERDKLIEGELDERYIFYVHNAQYLKWKIFDAYIQSSAKFQRNFAKFVLVDQEEKISLKGIYFGGSGKLLYLAGINFGGSGINPLTAQCVMFYCDVR